MLRRKILKPSRRGKKKNQRDENDSSEEAGNQETKVFNLVKENDFESRIQVIKKV